MLWSRKKNCSSFCFTFRFREESMYLALFDVRSFAYLQYMMYTYLYSRTKRTSVSCELCDLKKESIGICVKQCSE